MWRAVSAPRELWLGILYLAFGVVGLWFAQDYPFGTAGRMGPGYLPTMVAAVLALFGAASLARAFLLHGERIGAIALRPLLLVLGGVLAFAALAERAGLIIAIAALVLISATASARFRFEWTAALGLVGFIAFCAIIFVQFLGVPLPLLGTWFGR